MPFFRRKVGEVPAVLAAKWPGRSLDEGFTPFPKRLTRCMDHLFVGASAINHLRIVLAIVDYTRPDMTRPPSYEFLSFTAGMSIDKFKEGVEAMAQKGWLEVRGPDEAVSIGINGLVRKIEELTDEPEEIIERYEKN